MGKKLCESPQVLKMGLWFSKEQCKVCVVGLDNSGKSTILNKMKPKEASINEVTPTVGFTTEEFDYGNVTFQAWDMSGQSRYRELWQCYYPETRGIIFVVDSTDAVRMCVVQDELGHLLKHPDTAGKPILVFSNKKDRPDSMDVAKVWDTLELDKIRPCHPDTAKRCITRRGFG